MGSPTPVILKVTTPQYKKLIVEASDGIRYYSDLSSMSRVYCFPKNKSAWNQVKPDDHGLSLIWTSRFEVHIDQVIGLAFKTERIPRSA